MGSDNVSVPLHLLPDGAEGLVFDCDGKNVGGASNYHAGMLPVVL